MWVILAVAAYSAVVSILPFTPLTRFVWPRYVLEVENLVGRPGRLGIFNHPVINGMALALGFAIAMLMAGRRSEPVWQRRAAIVIAVACGVGIYETHTRAAWLGGLAVLVIGALLARGKPQGIHHDPCSAHRDGGPQLVDVHRVPTGRQVASDPRTKVQSRLNDIQTAFWGNLTKTRRRLGNRPVSVRQHLSPSAMVSGDPVQRGLAEVSHQNELAITAELSVIGLSMDLRPGAGRPPAVGCVPDPSG